jgi:hypothetical protein
MAGKKGKKLKAAKKIQATKTLHKGGKIGAI